MKQQVLELLTARTRDLQEFVVAKVRTCLPSSGRVPVRPEELRLLGAGVGVVLATGTLTHGEVVFKYNLTLTVEPPAGALSTAPLEREARLVEGLEGSGPHEPGMPSVIYRSPTRASA